MNFNEVKQMVSDEVELFKNGYEFVPFTTDINSKDDKILSKLFQLLPLKGSSSKIENITIGERRQFKIHIDDVGIVLKTLEYMYEKYHDADIMDWINDIKYHLAHYKSKEDQ